MVIQFYLSAPSETTLQWHKTIPACYNIFSTFMDETSIEQDYTRQLQYVVSLHRRDEYGT